MKHFVVCLTLALFCGVVLSDSFTNSTNPWVCSEARRNITKAVEGIETQRKRMYPDANEIARLENSILYMRQIANFTCTSEELCYDAKSGIAKAREDLATQNRRMYPDAKIISRLNEDIAYFKDQIDRTCPGVEVCANAKAEVKKTKEEIATQKRRMYPDAKIIASLEEDVLRYKRVIAWRCPANESCAFAHVELSSSREALATEKRRMYPDAKEVAKLEADINNSSEIIMGTCNTTEVCNFISTEMSKAQDAINTENRRMYPDRNAIAKLEGYMYRMREVQFYRCNGGNSGFMRLAENVVRGGRFLAKLLRH